MNHPKFGRNVKGLALYLYTLAILTTYSCITTTGKTAPGYGAVPLPSYTKGTTFVYSNGTWETVLATAPDSVTWINHRRDISSGSPDFTLRRTKWETDTRQGTRQFGPREDLIIKSETSLWPLQVGNEANFTETGVWFDKKKAIENSYHTDWSCSVEGTEQISVMAGEFDTWKIECKRYYVSGSKSQSHLREVETWFYAPEVDHYVLRTSRYQYQNSTRRLELLAVLPPLDGLPVEARSDINRSFQHALEYKKSGESLQWKGPAADVSVEITPAGTFRTPDGSFSRRYVQKLSLPAGQRIYYGMAVRGTDGVWAVPRR
jgi:hypothetical protein